MDHILDGPRAASPVEVGEAADLADRVFTAGSGAIPHHMASMFPLFFSAQNSHHLRVFAERESGRLVALVGIRVVEVSVYGHRVPLGCIGSVVTDERWRGRGLATRLLEDAFRILQEERVPLVWISGGRGLYRRLGCRDAGVYHVFEVSEGLGGAPAGLRAAARYGLAEVAPGLGRDPGMNGVPGLGGATDTAVVDAEALTRAPAFRQLAELYWKEPVRFVRPLDVFAVEFAAAGLARAMGYSQRAFLVTLPEGGPAVAGWIVAVPPGVPAAGGVAGGAAGSAAGGTPSGAGTRNTKARVLEAFGDRDTLVQSAPAVAAAVGVPLEVIIPQWDAGTVARFRRQGTPERLRSMYGTVKVLSGERLVEVLSPYLLERLGERRAGEVLNGEPPSWEEWLWGPPPAGPGATAGQGSPQGTPHGLPQPALGAVAGAAPGVAPGGLPLPLPWPAGLDYV